MDKKTVLFLFAFATACGAQTFSDTSQIIGSDDRVWVDNSGSNIPEHIRPLMNSIGLMKFKNSDGMRAGCTATHLGEGLVVTAGHCIHECESITVTWGVRGSEEGYLKSQCTEIVNSENTDFVDYAFFKVDNAPESFISADFSWVVPSESPTALAVLAHHELKPLQFSTNCVTSGVNGQSDAQFTHDCDTLGGGSGAAIIDANTLKVIGIHNGAFRLVTGDVINYGTYFGPQQLHLVPPQLR